MVVFFHGNNATLARDVVERQQTVRQLAQANLNAVLVAPQMAVDARDSSAGNFWRAGAFAQFLDEADAKLAALYPQASRAAFRRMPVILVAYSGGYLPAAYSLAYGGAGDRIRGVVLLDALYGEPDKFARWIESETRPRVLRQRLFRLVEGRNVAMQARLERDGVHTVTGLPATLRPRRRRLRRCRRRQPRRFRQRRLDQRSAARRAVENGTVGLPFSPPRSYGEGPGVGLFGTRYGLPRGFRNRGAPHPLPPPRKNTP